MKKNKIDTWDSKSIPDDHPRPQDDVPYERIMLHIINDYKRLKSSLKRANNIIIKQKKEIESYKQSKATREEMFYLRKCLTEKNEIIKGLKGNKKNQLIQELRLEIEEKDKIIRKLQGE